MSILIVAATAFEIKPSLAFIKRQGMDVVVTGTGVPFAIYEITKAIARFQPEFIVQAGIAGCFDKQLPLGQVYTVCEDFFGDIGVREQGQWRSVADLGFLNPDRKPFKAGRLRNPGRKLLKACGLDSVAAVTVSTISTNNAMIRLFKNGGAVLESMEGAALHYVALRENIPFLQLRAVSNYIGQRDKTKWQFTEALQNLNAELRRILSSVILSHDI